MSEVDDTGIATPVVVTSVMAKGFGKWSDRRLDLGKSTAESTGAELPGMTVVFGPNQAGKSTFATLVQWLFGGPGELRPADVAHLGEPGQTLTGSMEGRIGSDEFSVDGSFTIQRKGPLKTQLTVLEGTGADATTYNLESWTDRLRGVDAAVMESVYCLWGADLHQVSDIDAQLEGISMGRLRGRNPREVIAALNSAAHERSKARGQSAVSVTTIQRRIKELDQELRAARGNTDEYVRVQTELAAAAALADSAAALRAEHAQELAALQTAIEALSVVERIRGLEVDLAALPIIPEDWAAVLAERSRLVGIDEQLTAAEQAAVITEHALRSAMEPVGLTRDALDELRISDSDVATISGLVTDWRSAIDFGARAETSLADTRRAVEAAEKAADDAAHELPEVEPTAIDRARLGHEERQQILSRILEAETAVAEATKAEGELREAAVDRDTAIRQHEHALAAWHTHHGDIDPSKWMAETIDGSRTSSQNSGTGTTTGGTSGGVDSWPQWLGVAALIVMAALASGLRQWVIAAIAAASALVIAVIQLSRRPSSPPVGPIVGESTDSSTAFGAFSFESASAVAVAGQAIAEATTALTRAQNRVDLAQENAAAATAAVRDVASSYGVDVRGPLTQVRAELDRWSKAVEATTRLRELRSEYEAAVARLGEATTQVDALAARVTEHLESLGLPAPARPDGATDVLTAHREAITAWKDHMAATAPIHDLGAKWDQLVSPIATSTNGWSRRRILDELESLTSEAPRRSNVETEYARERALLDGYLLNARVAAILEDEPTTVELELREERLTADHAEAEAGARSAHERVGALSQDLERLGSDSAIAEINTRLGGLTEEQNELAIEAAAAAVAAHVLGEVADDYQRENQPELVRHTSTLATRITTDWSSVQIGSVGADTNIGLLVEQASGTLLPASKLSTGAKGLLQLALRLSLARSHLARRGISMPLICDDPFVHFSDDWARSGMTLLAEEASERQVIMFTCHRRSAETAHQLGARVVELGQSDDPRG